jgi:aspartate aminotransferase-like enzyme
MPGRGDIFSKQYLMTAGPTPLPPLVSQVMAEPIVYHRAPVFLEAYERSLGRLREVFQTRNEVLAFTSSGSGAMESAVANLVRPGEPAVVASAGKFGERWRDLCEAWGAKVEYLDVPWGEKIDPAALAGAIERCETPPAAVFVTHSETSTGVLHDVRALNEVATDGDSILCVDAVSSLGAVDLPQDEWGIDVVVSGSQKALMCPPGLSFASVSERALARAAENTAPRFYFDWARTAKGQAKQPPSSPFTPAVTLWRALDVALGLIFEEGLPQVFERHSLLARAARAGIEAAGLDRFGPEDDEANVVTVASLPDSIDGAKVPKLMRDRYGVTVAGGQERLQGKIVRIAHCGYYGAFDIVVALTALEMALRELGHECEVGAAPAAAQKVFAEAGVAPEPVRSG